jgi:hypothetical protein
MAKGFVTCLAVAFLLLLTHEMDAKEKSERVLRHIVCFKFTDEAKEVQIAAVVKAFAALENKIPAVKGFETGTNNSPEGLNKKFTHCFVVTFADEKGRDEYLPHPEHKKFVKLLKPILDDVFVIDYWSR